MSAPSASRPADAVARAAPGPDRASIERGRRATIEDVATGAGVSVATVSRALRNLPNVADSTRRRVNDVALRLAYQPDPAAARLAAGRTGTVSVVVPSLSGWYFSTVVAGAEAVVADAGLEFQVIGVSSPSERDRLLDDARRLERRTDGLVLVDVAISPEQVGSLESRRIALATVGTSLTGHPSVGIDDELVGRLAARHLVGLGHRHLGLIGGMAEDPMNFDVPLARRTGFERELALHGLGLDAADVANGNFGIEGGHEAMSELLDRDEPASAFFAMSDEMAFGALMAMRERGIRPGVDASILGVDDHEFSCVVELTTIRQDVAEHGARAARALLSVMEGDPASPVGRPVGPVEVAVGARRHSDIEVVVRSTTGPCAPVGAGGAAAPARPTAAG